MKSSMLIKTCEFTGDEINPHDGKPSGERLCEHLGYGRCLKHNAPLMKYQGWAMCAEQCSTPFQVKEVEVGK